jgi:hypothetical protein
MRPLDLTGGSSVSSEGKGVKHVRFVNPANAPVLALFLTSQAGMLKAAVGTGVGLAAVIGTLRFVYDWSLKPIIYLATVPTLLLTAYALTDPQMTS